MPFKIVSLAWLRQSDGLSLLRLAKEELKRAGVHLAAVQFVACEEPLDLASPNSAATLWVQHDGGGAEGDVGQLAVAATGGYKCISYKHTNPSPPRRNMCEHIGLEIKPGSLGTI